MSATDTPLKKGASLPAKTSFFHDRRWHVLFSLAFLFALLSRIPFFATHHIQEDAYITFRSAFHLADFGNYSFNLGDHAPGVTSTIYGPYIALIRLIFHGHAIGALSVLNTAIFLAGAALLACSVFGDWPKRIVFFLLIGILPAALLITYTGMEIPLQAAVFCATIFSLRRGQPTFVTLAGVVLLPLIRPDAIAYSLILSLLAFSFDRIRGTLAIVCSFAGEALVLVFNRLFTGNFITATMRAKEVAYHPGHGIQALLHSAKIILLTRSYLLPVESKFLERASPLVTFLVLVGCAWALWLSRRQTTVFRLLVACFAAGILVPVAYMAGGIIFPWYLWTPNWLCDALVCYGIVRAATSQKPLARAASATFVVMALLAMDGAQWLVSANIGLQEYHYRADVGRWLHQVAAPSDTLELEPAGYIPFYAGLRTYDEVGLVSPLVLQYRTKFGAAWWMLFLKQQHPDWLVERDYVAEHRTMDGQPFSPDDTAWFDAHYKLVRRFHYSPANYLKPGLRLKLLKYGTHDDYFVYRYTPSQ